MIDVRAGLLSPTLRALRDIGFIDAAKKSQLTFAVFHILGPSIASLDEIADTSAFMTDAKYFLVKNFINNTTSSSGIRRPTTPISGRSRTPSRSPIPKLNEMAYEQVELASVPFVSFVANKGPSGEAANYSFVLRGYVRHWLGNVWAEYDRVKLNDIVAAEPQRRAPRGKAARRDFEVLRLIAWQPVSARIVLDHVRPDATRARQSSSSPRRARGSARRCSRGADSNSSARSAARWRPSTSIRRCRARRFPAG